jgi:hypothetical protein
MDLSNRFGWPAWLTEAIEYLQTISTEGQWMALLEKFVEFERKLGFSGTVSGVPCLNHTDTKSV